MCKNDNVIIITIDDDVIYPYDLIEKLLKRSKIYSAIGFCGYNVKDLIISKKHFYSNLIYENRNPELKFVTDVDILEGYRGILYKFFFFNDNIYNPKNFSLHAYYVDDVWISLNLAINNIKRLAFKYDKKLHYLIYNTIKVYGN